MNQKKYWLFKLFKMMSSIFVMIIPLEIYAQKISPEVLLVANTQGTAEAIVHLTEEADLRATALFYDRTQRIRFVYKTLVKTAEKSQANIIEKLRHYGIEHRAYYIQNAILIERASKNLLFEIAAMPEVKKISLNARVKMQLPDMGTKNWQQAATDVPSNISQIGADKVWTELGVRGEGIVIAGQDSGFDWKHPSLKSKYRGFKSDGSVDHNYNWHDAIQRRLGRSPNPQCPPKSSEPCDDTDHDTHTMGTMVGDEGSRNKIGVAPGAKWIGCRNMDKGVGTPATYLECFEYFLAPYPYGGNSRTLGRPDLAPHIINNSWSCPESEGCEGDELIGAVRAMSAAGILVVVSAGNNGPSCGTIASPPGSYHGDVFVVGAYNAWTKDIAFFSNRGPSAFNGGVGVDVVAPGVAIRSSVQGGNGYDDKSGTSMAAPHVSGVAALLWSARPDLIGKTQTTFDRLRATSTPFRSGETCGPFSGSQIPNATFGYGMINAFKAISAP